MAFLNNNLFGILFGKDIPEQNNGDKKIIKKLNKTTNRQKQSTAKWREAIIQAEHPFVPLRQQMQELYLDTVLNSQVIGCIERRKDLTLLRNWEFTKPSGALDKNTMELMDKIWFKKFISYSLDALFYGYSLIQLGSIIENEFKNIKVARRDFVSPDYDLYLDFPSALVGTNILEPKYYNWNILIKTDQPSGVNNCGYGLLYPVGILEIYLRNILGLNADFVELYTQPFRVGKTDKTNEEERDFLQSALADFGANSWILMDKEDEISFLDTSNGGNPYESYGDFEKRLEQKISKVILGHADALDSVPGKLGAGSGEDNPVHEALEDKQNNDAIFIENIINNELIPRMNALGFNIKSKFQFINDDEQIDRIEGIIDTAINMSKAGLNMEKEYFTKQTGIPLEEPLPMQIPPQEDGNKE